MKIYCFNPETREYLYSHDCQMSPLEPGNFLKPTNNYSLNQPPVWNRFETIICNEDLTWTIVHDYRGTKLYNKKTGISDLKITKIKEEIPNTHTLIKKENNQSYIIWNEEQNNWIEDEQLKLQYYKDLKNNEIKNSFYNIFNEGFTSPTLNITIDCRRDGLNNDIQNYTQLLDLLKSGVTSEVQIRCKDNSLSEPLDQDKLQTLINETTIYGIQMYQKKWLLNEQVNNCNTYEELELIKW
jgi:hypothetical protein